MNTNNIPLTSVFSDKPLLKNMMKTAKYFTVTSGFKIPGKIESQTNKIMLVFITSVFYFLFIVYLSHKFMIDHYLMQ